MNYLSYILPYVEYFCFFPINLIQSKTNENNQNITNTNDQINTRNQNITNTIATTTLNITNETTKEKVNLSNVMFDNENLNVIVTDENNEKKILTLDSIIINIVEKLNWNINEQVIIVSDQIHYYSYGIEYFCIRNNKNEIIDICVLNTDVNTSVQYTSIVMTTLTTKEYDYFIDISTDIN